MATKKKELSPQSRRLENVIYNYLSDTFSARTQNVTKAEARTLSNRLINRLAECTGSVYVDGVVLDEMLDHLRRRGR